MKIRIPRLRRAPDPAPAAAAARDERPAAAAADPDWFDRLYAEPDTPGPEKEPARIPWWQRHKPATGDQAAEDDTGETLHTPPGVHITINQPGPQAPEPSNPRRARLRRWLLVHGVLAGIGWYIGIGPALADLYASSGQSGRSLGVGMTLICIIFGAYLPGLGYVPVQLRPIVVALCRIPACTAVLALALHAPDALI
ncbi:hypothetical protein [Streptomyces sp. NPDC048438]|uniref:hypothetical protein n=1 Tax=Streptomyces sp. NPDC048438 TaxID=3365551 RepID=UPI00371485CA